MPDCSIHTLFWSTHHHARRPLHTWGWFWHQHPLWQQISPTHQIHANTRCTIQCTTISQMVLWNCHREMGPNADPRIPCTTHNKRKLHRTGPSTPGSYGQRPHPNSHQCWSAMQQVQNYTLVTQIAYSLHRTPLLGPPSQQSQNWMQLWPHFRTIEKQTWNHQQ